MKKRIPIIILTGLLLGACGSLVARGAAVNNGYGYRQGGNFASNGEQIYFTAMDKDGKLISYTGGPAFGNMMMGAYLACVSCHGPDARGGTHYMHMQVMDAPPIYYDALLNMMQEESGSPQMTTYTIDDFRQAVVEGKHPDGDQLDQDMPRWQMSDSDLADLLAFLKTLP